MFYVSHPKMCSQEIYLGKLSGALFKKALKLTHWSFSAVDFPSIHLLSQKK